MMGGETDLLSVVGSVYRGAVDPQHWSRGLDDVSRLFRGDFAVVEVRRRDRPDVFIETSSVRLDPKIHQAHDAHYGLICPRAATIATVPPGEVSHDGLIGDEAALDRDEYYADFLAPQGLRYFLACHVDALAGADVVISVQRPRAAGRASEAEIARFARLAPHLAEAYALRLTFGERLSLADGMERAAEMSDAAFLLLGADGRARYASRAARALLTAAFPALTLTHAGIAAAGRGRRRLQRLVGAALAGGTGGALRLPEAGVRVRVAPMRADAAAPEQGVAAVVILERLPEAGPAALTLLRARYGLTAREAEIAADLCAGLNPGEIAEIRGLRLSTVRTHIARARDKAGARSIAELVLLALRGGAGST